MPHPQVDIGPGPGWADGDPTPAAGPGRHGGLSSWLMRSGELPSRLRLSRLLPSRLRLSRLPSPKRAALRQARLAAAGPDRVLSAALLDLHRRNQRLVHDQLCLLDRVERRELDEDTLAYLFRADHLAVRLRRNVENAISLSGGQPGRRWRRPVGLVDVVRAAAAEVEDYSRISTAQVAPAQLAGSAVTDVAHLLAELIENAASYSPPSTRVGVAGVADPGGGYTLTVSDVGPGLSAAALAAAERLITAAESPGGETEWGFFVVGRLAARQDIAVRLAPGPAGGLAATVSLPPALIIAVEPDGTGAHTPPLSRVARMRARVRAADGARGADGAGPAGPGTPATVDEQIHTGQAEAQ